MAEPVLHLDRVTRDFGSRVVTRVLHGISLTVHPGELAALVGPSGSGKSTLLNIIGLLDHPTSGRVLLQGVDTSNLDDKSLTHFRGRTIGFVFQFHHLLPAFTAVENVVMPMYAEKGRPTPAMKVRALELLDRVGLSAHATKRATDLSGGQQQRVAIARALAMSPPLILADEPTGNLDTHSAEQVFSLLRQFNEQQHSAMLLVTHDARLAARCDRRIELVDGQICSDTKAQ